MSDKASHDAGSAPQLPDRDRPPSEPDRKTRGQRHPTRAELALLRWLADKPRPVSMGPVGNCVKRGWCEPVRAVVDDHEGRRLSFIYVVTEAGSRLIEEHASGERERGERATAGATGADGAEAGVGKVDR